MSKEPRRPRGNFFLRGIDEAVFLEARARCLLQGLKLGELVTNLLREWLKVPKPKVNRSVDGD